MNLFRHVADIMYIQQRSVVARGRLDAVVSRSGSNIQGAES